MPGTRPGIRVLHKVPVSTFSHDEQIVRLESNAGLDLRQRDRRGRGYVGAEVERLVRSIKMEYHASRELVVARTLEHRRRVHMRAQSAAVAAGGYHDVILLGGVVEVGDGADAV